MIHKNALRKGLIIILLLVLCGFLACHRKEMRKVTLSVNGRPIMVEIARTKEQRAHGLMYRDYLPWNEGMLFVFKQDKILSFWMKNTRIPLSIAFLDNNGKVTDIFHMEPNSLVPVTSRSKCRYALEVNRGFFSECGLAVGDKIDLTVIR